MALQFMPRTSYLISLLKLFTDLIVPPQNFFPRLVFCLPDVTLSSKVAHIIKMIFLVSFILDWLRLLFGDQERIIIFRNFFVRFCKLLNSKRRRSARIQSNPFYSYVYNSDVSFFIPSFPRVCSSFILFFRIHVIHFSYTVFRFSLLFRHLVLFFRSLIRGIYCVGNNESGKL